MATKLHVPVPLGERTSRAALVETLHEATQARVILISAPAGSGKTTLLASWHASADEPRPFAWLSLDRHDNDPVRFWGGILAAVRTVTAGFADAVDAALRLPGVDLAELALPLLVNALAELPRRIVLALDDYHEVENPDIHRSVQFLVDHLPQTVQIAVATRVDPPFALARLRARGELLEVRAPDLRLQADEATALLNGSMHLGLEPDQVRALQEHTEGWAAGLQLVGLSLRGRTDREQYIASFAGDDRQIVDYLAAEVLDRQTPAMRAFLLRTSILERLCGPLCDTVLDTRDSAGMLVALERANLFVVPLDGRRVWYRYHHLFAELLRHELELTEPESMVELHERACEWHVAHGLIPEAIRHACHAGDYGTAAELIAANWLTYVNRGQLEAVEAWTRALPREVAVADPRLCLARAWMLLVLGRPDEVEPAVQMAERGVHPGPMRDGSRSIESSAAMVRTSARLLVGDVGAGSQAAALAAELEPDAEAPWRPIVTNALGMTAYWSGDTVAALDAFSETVATGELVANHTATIYALGYLATMAAERQDREAAERHAARALALAERQQLGQHWVTVMAQYAAGHCARAAGDLAGARAKIELGLQVARRARLRLDTVYGLLELASLATAAGDRERARAFHERAERQLAACPDPGILSERINRSAGTRARAGRGRGHRGSADELSERELTLVRLLPSQLSLREIGDEMYVSFNTVKTHARNVYAKLRVGSREEAVARAHELHLV